MEQLVNTQVRPYSSTNSFHISNIQDNRRGRFVCLHCVSDLWFAQFLY